MKHFGLLVIASIDNRPSFITVPVLTSTYRPDKGKDVEERLYSAAENPSPALDLLEQIMTMQVKGHVSVYIENENDLSSLHNIIKVCTCTSLSKTSISPSSF